MESVEDTADLLSDEDRAYLERQGKKWTVAKVDLPEDRYELRITVHDYDLPDKYSPRQTDLLVRQLPGYPQVGMDMFWTKPTVHLAGTAQMPDRADVFNDPVDLQWQRWSRHMNGWRAGIDNLETFMAAVRKELS